MYEYHVFLSYRRRGEWPRWVNDHFYSLLDHWLSEELGQDAEIAVDTRFMETGSDWPSQLAHALSSSMTMVALWSKQYFSSRWCKEELTLMLAREEACGIPAVAAPGRLIVPAAIHDGEDEHLPPPVRQIQRLALQDLANPRMTSDSPRGEELSDRIKDWVPDIAAAIARAPDWDAEWSNLATAAFASAFGEQGRQTRPPSLG